jgi:hypothetical protein
MQIFFTADLADRKEDIMYGNCRDCAFWRDAHARIPANCSDPRTNNCVRNAPVYLDKCALGVYPQTGPYSGCGDFEPSYRARDEHGNLI